MILPVLIASFVENLPERGQEIADIFIISVYADIGGGYLYTCP
jgi:hypothetical protein